MEGDTVKEAYQDLWSPVYALDGKGEKLQRGDLCKGLAFLSLRHAKESPLEVLNVQR